MVVGVVTGGRWSDEAVAFLRVLAQGRAQEVPGYMRRAAELAWARRWARMLSTACARSLAASLVEPQAALTFHAPAGGEAPSPAQLLDGFRAGGA